MMGYYRFTQWTTRDWALKIARNSNFPVMIAKQCFDDYKRGSLFAVVRCVPGNLEKFKEVLTVEELGG